MKILKKILEIEKLYVEYRKDEERIKAVNGISFYVKEGECLGIVGETGAGKTTTALSILNLISLPQGEILDGKILFKNKNIRNLKEIEIRKIRGKEISMIFQDPMTSLNPVLTIGEQIIEVIMSHENITKKEALKKAEEALKLVEISKERMWEYPHQFSGGMKQRVVIAMALVCNPKLLIADEPTTALDVTIQAQVLDLMQELKEKLNMSMILITHDLGVVGQMCERVAIMYAGEIIEMGELEKIYKNPKHPYTIGLFNSIPSLERIEKRLYSIKGEMPDPTNLPNGCKFHPRCPKKIKICEEKNPIFIGDDLQKVRCFLYNRRED